MPKDILEHTLKYTTRHLHRLLVFAEVKGAVRYPKVHVLIATSTVAVKLDAQNEDAIM